MKNSTFFLTYFFMLVLTVLCINPQKATAQNSPESVLSIASLEEISSKDINLSLLGQIILCFPYGKSSFSNPQDAALLKKLKITKVELVYSWNATLSDDKDIRQKKLNIKRLDALYAIAPELFANPKIQWNLKVQTDFQKQTEAQEFFHGFIIHYQMPKQ